MRTSKIIFILMFLFFLLSCYVILNTVMHRKVISIATGSERGAYYEYALAYKKFLAEDGIELKIRTTDGSIKAQELLVNGEVDFTFVQGGTEVENILALANVEYEPIWIFYKDERLNSLRMLKDKRVAIGRKQSGIYPISKELLTTVGVDINSSNFEMISSKDAVRKLKNGTLDAMFYVASDKASIVNELMLMKNAHLMDFDKADAYRQYSLRKDKYYECVTLKKSGFDYEKHLPIKKHLLLAKTSLVATINASDDMVRLMLKVMTKVHKKASMFHKENTFPNVTKLKIQQHSASVDFFQKRETFLETKVNFWLAQTLDGLYTISLFFFFPFIAIFAFVVEVIMPAYAHYSRLKINRWYYLVNEIDTGMDDLSEKEINEKIDFLHKLLSKIRDTDDIPAIHMGPFYTLQNQIVTIISDLEKQKSVFG